MEGRTEERKDGRKERRKAIMEGRTEGRKEIMMEGKDLSFNLAPSASRSKLISFYIQYI